MVLDVLSETPGLVVEGTHRSNPSDALYFDVEIEVTRLEEILRSRGKYQYVINCIGATKTDIDETDSRSVRRAILLNALFPHHLADLVREMGVKALQISTDGVFEGRAQRYFEDSPRDSTDVYGKTKSLGEVPNSDFLNIRCSIIGPDPNKGKGLLEWFLSQPTGSEIPGYVNYYWNGVTTLQFAELCRRIIIDEVFADIIEESPVHHFCPNHPVSKCQLLEIFRMIFKKDVRIVPFQGPEKVASRILGTHYTSLGRLLGSEVGMVEAVEQLHDRLCMKKTEQRREENDPK